jgi:hypothetical protein
MAIILDYLGNMPSSGFDIGFEANRCLLCKRPLPSETLLRFPQGYAVKRSHNEDQPQENGNKHRPLCEQKENGLKHDLLFRHDNQFLGLGVIQQHRRNPSLGELFYT